MKEELIQARRILISQHDVGYALSVIKPYIYDNHTKVINNDFEDIVTDYNLMKDFVIKGYHDPKRDDVYNRIVRQCYELCNNAIVQEKTMNGNSYADAAGQSRGLCCDQNAITKTMEGFVQDVAMASLDNDADKNEKLNTIYYDHQVFIQNLFCEILISRQWKDGDFSYFSKLLLSPAIDINDACVLISSVTLATINVFDFNKFKTLSSIYANASDEKLKQRALVGMVLSLPEGEENIYPELKRIIDDVIDDGNNQNELLELQLQILFCMNADADAQKIKTDIMPNIIKNNNLTITRAGIEEKDEDAMQDILNPGDADKAMEEVEKSFSGMIDMQKQGSDIYFGGFSQMKRFPFFYKMSNWFCPFYLEHPDLKNVSEKLQGSKFLTLLLEHGPFCDSDKYSFALSMATVIMNIPDNLKEILNNEDAFGPTANDEDITKPAYLRRMYLQDLYRFFRLYQFKQDFINPFAYGSGKGLFFCNAVIRKSPLGRRIADVMNFLINHHLINKSFDTIIKLYDGDKFSDVEYLKLSALVKLKNGDYDAAYKLLAKLLESKPSDIQILKGMAKAAFHENRYDESIKCYDKLISMLPDDYHLLLDKAILQVNTSDYKLGMNVLFKLNYEHPSDANVMRAMAWGHLRDKQPDKALDVYMKLFEKGNKASADYLNCGYAKWFINDIEGAAGMFKRFMKTFPDVDENSGRKQLASEFFTDEQLLKSYEITPIDEKIIIDLAID